MIPDEEIEKYYIRPEIFENSQESNFSIIKMDLKNVPIFDLTLKKLGSTPDKILLVPFCDTFFPNLIAEPWIGFIHYGVKNLVKTSKNLLNNDSFVYSLKYCLFLVVMSPDLEEFWSQKVKTILIPHPFEPVFNYISRPRNVTTLLSVGTFYRDFELFKKFQVENLEKVRIDKHSFKVSGVKNLKKISWKKYYQLLEESIVFCVTIDLAACVTILECIYFNTPVIVQRCPASEYYLGEGYPMFYGEFKLTSELIEETRIYLSGIQTLNYTQFKDILIKETDKIYFKRNTV